MPTMKSREAVLTFALFAVTVAAPSSTRGDESVPSPVTATADPVKGILEAFRSHQIVALTDPHGDEQMHQFLLTLIRRPEFAALADDIVVESGNARYQQLMDRYIRGEEVDPNALREVWRNTTQHQILDHPQFEEFVRAVRTVNLRLPPAERLRVVLGDPPIDWEFVRSAADHREWIEMRDWFPAAVIQTEVLARRRRALVVYGQMHLQRKQLLANYDMDSWQAQTVVSVLQRTTPAAIFTIWTVRDPARLQRDLIRWTKPGLVLLRGTALGAAEFERFYDAPGRFQVVDGKLVPIPKEQWRTLRIEDQFDALLYLGPSAQMAVRRPPPAVCADQDYMQMRIRRLTVTNAAERLIDQLRRPCAGATP